MNNNRASIKQQEAAGTAALPQLFTDSDDRATTDLGKLCSAEVHNFFFSGGPSWHEEQNKLNSNALHGMLCTQYLLAVWLYTPITLQRAVKVTRAKHFAVCATKVQAALVLSVS